MEMKTPAQPAQYSASDIASYFIWKAENEGLKITNKKLQKLLYYSQAWHLVFNDGKPLFGEDIEAWVHGPVVRNVYNFFKKFGFMPITLKNISNPVDSQKTLFLDQIWSVYGGFDAEYLEMLTHREKPWQDARRDIESKERSNTVIDLNDMRNFYQNKLDVSEAKYS